MNGGNFGRRAARVLRAPVRAHGELSPEGFVGAALVGLGGLFAVLRLMFPPDAFAGAWTGVVASVFGAVGVLVAQSGLQARRFTVATVIAALALFAFVWIFTPLAWAAGLTR